MNKVKALNLNRPKKLRFESLVEAVAGICGNIVDERQVKKSEYEIKDAVLSGLAMMYHQDPSMLQFQGRTKEEKANLKNVFGIRNIPRETQMRKILDEVKDECFRIVFKDFISRLKQSSELTKYKVFGNKYYLPLDGTTFFSSAKIECDSCLTRNYDDGNKTNHHQVLQTGIVHPAQKAVLPLMPEHIVNKDGMTKQDCEINAFKRMIPRIKADHPGMQFIIGGDGLFSKQPLINLVIENNMDYIFTAKPGNHTYLYEWVAAFEKLHRKECEEKKYICVYEWVNDVPLHGNEESVQVNFVRCTLSDKNKKKRDTHFSWVTNIPLSLKNIDQFVAVARCRWKNENEFFNVLKNHGYCLEHNYGHGLRNLAFNFYILTVLSFFMHQIFELTDEVYQFLRTKITKRQLFEYVRSAFQFLIFESWSDLLLFIADKRGIFSSA